MPPAAKKKKLRPTTPTGVSYLSTASGQSRLVRDAAVRCKRTKAYAHLYSALTLVVARRANRRIGTTGWYRMNKDALVATVVLHQLARRIQRCFRKYASPADDDDSGCDGSDEDHDLLSGGGAQVCPLSLVPISEIHRKHRYVHSNTCFNREFLAQHMSITSDFINPVTRVEFAEEDVLRIDPTLVEQFRNRKELRHSLVEDMAMVQSVENELEEVFQDMVEAAQEIPSRREFRIVFDNLSEDFQERHDDLVEIDRDRSRLTLKSLESAIRGDPAHPVHISRKREAILRNFLELQTI